MCCLPCWPVRDIVLEDVPETPMFQYVWNGTNWVPTISDNVSLHRLFPYSLASHLLKPLSITRSPAL
ncbi:hypothetical protein GGR51DRAFT_519778 [Nemania sp. FL0031]|nr:hypothetical protein GGR51DRAFT_519778 [Nemania sp. FL0031]